jgi:hypothetical protein
MRSVSLNIENLNTGEIFKNYKHLCEVLEMEVKNGAKGKQYQLKELERFCKLKKEGRRFIIEEVYESPLPKTDERKQGNNNVYGELIQLLILDLLAQTDKGTITISRSKLLRSIDMTNINYGHCGENVPTLARYIKAEEAVVYDFYNTSNSNFKNSVESALKKLEDKRIVTYTTVTKVCDENGSLRLATDEEKELILEYEKSVLDELGFKQVSQVRCSSKWKEYKNKVKKLLQKYSDINFHYIAYHITVNQKYIDQELEHLTDLLLSDLQRAKNKFELNTTVCENLLSNAKKRHSKASQFSVHNKMKKYRNKDSYIEKIEKLIDLLIDSSQSSVSNELVKMEIEEKEELELLEMLS